MAKSNPATTNGRRIMKDHLKHDKKLLKERIKLEKKDLKNNQAHSRDHTIASKQNRTAISRYSSELKSKSKTGGTS